MCLTALYETCWSRPRLWLAGVARPDPELRLPMHPPVLPVRRREDLSSRPSPPPWGASTPTHTPTHTSERERKRRLSRSRSRHNKELLLYRQEKHDAIKILASFATVKQRFITAVRTEYTESPSGGQDRIELAEQKDKPGASGKPHVYFCLLPRRPELPTSVKWQHLANLSCRSSSRHTHVNTLLITFRTPAPKQTWPRRKTRKK